MKLQCIANLNEIKELLHQLQDEEYQYKSPILSGATIGQHVRHILEFYSCLLRGLESEIINYDKRERDLEIETCKASAINLIDAIISKLIFINNDKSLKLAGNFTVSKENGDHFLNTSLNRELAYNLEHSIHHQALIKVGLKELCLEPLIDGNFGVAAATIRFYDER